MNRRMISLGGWCGPSLMLSKLGLTNHQTQLPFDMVRCTLDGIAEFTRHGFGGEEGKNFFPEKIELEINNEKKQIYNPDPVSIWLLFRGWHTAFTHYDLNRKEVRDIFLERMKRWKDLVECNNNTSTENNNSPVTFLRTSISEDPYAEMRFIPRLQKVFDETSKNKLNHRIILVHHDCSNKNINNDKNNNNSRITNSTGPTRPLFFINDRAIMWSLEHDEEILSNPEELKSASLFDKAEKGYNKIISECSSEENWNYLKKNVPSLSELKKNQGNNNNLNLSNHLPKFEKSSLLSRVEGVSTFRGTCTGFGSTDSAALSGKICLSCGNRDGHAVKNLTAFDHLDREWTAEEDEFLMLTLMSSLNNDNNISSVDTVAIVEHAANHLNRGANETLQRMKSFGFCSPF